MGSSSLFTVKPLLPYGEHSALQSASIKYSQIHSKRDLSDSFFKCNSQLQWTTGLKTEYHRWQPDKVLKAPQTPSEKLGTGENKEVRTGEK